MLLSHRWASVGPRLWKRRTLVPPLDYILCRSEIIASESSSTLVCHACIMFIQCIFTAQIFANMFNWIQQSVWKLWLLQSPHCQIPETNNFQAYTCVVPVASFEQLIKGTNSTSPCTRPRVFLLAFLETNPCPTLYPTYLLFLETIKGSTYSIRSWAVLTLLLLFSLRLAVVVSIELGHSGLKYTPRRSPASRYIP